MLEILAWWLIVSVVVAGAFSVLLGLGNPEHRDDDGQLGEGQHRD